MSDMFDEVYVDSPVVDIAVEIENVYFDSFRPAVVKCWPRADICHSVKGLTVDIYSDGIYAARRD